MFGSIVPAAVLLHVNNGLEIDRMQQDLGRMQTTQPFAHDLVDHPVIDGRAFKAHSTDEADLAHDAVPCVC
ncbi:hypothetical protein D3C87_1782830 [compost metagenome]